MIDSHKNTIISIFSEGEGPCSTFTIEIPVINKEFHAVSNIPNEGSPADTFLEFLNN